MLMQKQLKIDKVRKELESAKTQKQNFEQELHKAVTLNAGILTVCGKSHMKSGDTRRNCTEETECQSALLCGQMDKHPQEKALRKNLTQKVQKCESQLVVLQNDYSAKVRAYKTVEDSFARKIENDIIASNPDMYIVNGVKNWALLNKHCALLQKKCGNNLPPKHSAITLL